MVSGTVPWQGTPSNSLQVYLSRCCAGGGEVEMCVLECLERMRVQEGLWREDRAGEHGDGEPGP